MRLQVLVSSVAALTLLAGPAQADVRVSIANGNVTVSARDATVRQILAEWARVGQTRIVNLERIAGAPLTIELTDVPEAQALDTLLRSVSGYLAAPRAVSAPTSSRYDRIFILATSTGTPARPSPAPANPAPTFTPPNFLPPPAPDDQNGDDDAPQPRRSGAPVAPAGPPRGPTFNTFPQPAPPPPERDDAPQPAASPAAPVGVSTPGMLVPVPAPAGQPGQPQGRGSNVR
ncbi:MAG TPA: hypothetical protein VM032_14780 [Vicinamibacterales bacterium]|nr:hypothetical protein [Vicinamibacterales bacterium]